MSCGTVPKLEGTYSSAVNDNTMYFEYEAYTFSKSDFTYSFNTDVSGNNWRGDGSFEQDKFKVKLHYSDKISNIKSQAIIEKTLPNPFTFTLSFDIKAGNHIMQGANISIVNGFKIRKNYQTNLNGKLSITLASDTQFPIETFVQYLGYEQYSLTINSPENYSIIVDLATSVENLITSVTKEKDIRQKGSYIYINGKKFKKISE